MAWAWVLRLSARRCTTGAARKWPRRGIARRRPRAPQRWCPRKEQEQDLELEKLEREELELEEQELD